MKDLNKNIGLKSFLDKLDKYREDNIILLEILNTSEEYIGECFRENKITEGLFFKSLNIINSCKQDLDEIETTYINRLLIKKKQNDILQNEIEHLLTELHAQVRKDLINHNVYDRFKEYVDFTQDFHLSEKIY